MSRRLQDGKIASETYSIMTGIIANCLFCLRAFNKPKPSSCSAVSGLQACDPVSTYIGHHNVGYDEVGSRLFTEVQCFLTVPSFHYGTEGSENRLHVTPRVK